MKGTLRLFLVLCITALSMTLVQAQERTYSGVVKGSDGQPVIGASVEVVGTTVGTSTGLDGDYTIKANQGSKIKFSFLGTKSVTVTAGGSSTVNVTLEDDATALDEVVVQAFGTVKKKDLTGSVSSIDSKLISSQANSTLSKALEGSIPGLQVSAVDGQPGLDMGIRVRGIGTASQNNANALIVIDGVPNSNSNALSLINPKDVESITVLKDAASTALWGSRGANGVVMVTTKRGQKGKPKITFEGRWGINQATNNRADLMDIPQSYEWAWQSIYNSVRYGSDQPYTTNAGNPNMKHEEAALFASQHLFNYNGGAGFKYGSTNGLGNWMHYNVPGATYTNTGTSSTMTGAYLVGTDGKLNPNAQFLGADNWDDIFLKNKFRQEYNISVSGATENTDYYLSAGYLSDPSYILGSSFNRYNVRSNINTQVTKWLKAGINMAYSRRSVQQMANKWGRSSGSDAQNIFRYLEAPSNYLANYYQRDDKGNIVYDEKTGEKVVLTVAGQQRSPLGAVSPRIANNNPTYQMEHDKYNTTSNDLTARGYLEATFLKDFTFTANLAMDQTFEDRRRYLNPDWGLAKGVKGAIHRNYNNWTNLNSQQLLNWAHDYGKHHIDALIGHEFNWNTDYRLSYQSSFGLIDGFDAFANFIALNSSQGGGGWDNGGNENKRALEGYFGRVNYIYDNKYYVTASLRADGSSKFRYMEDRWGVFWSVGGAWRISAEPWAADATWLTDLKLRADYGVIGNQNGIGDYSGYQTWGYSADGWANSGPSQPKGWKISQNAMSNDPHLTWEKKKTVDVGLDFRLWDRFYGTLDWYQTNTTDMIWAAPISFAMSNTETLGQNTAEMRTRGFELELGVDIIKTPDILWSFAVNGAHYRSVLTKVPPGTGSDALNGCWTADADAWGIAGTTTSANSSAFLRGIGKPYYNMYLYTYAGVDQKTGLPLFASRVPTLSDEDKKDPSKVAAYQKKKDALAASHHVGEIVDGGIVNTTNYTLADKFEYGDATPDFMGGFSTSFRYKNLDFAATFAFQIGGLFESASYANGFYFTQNIGGALSSDMFGNTWTPENTKAYFPMQIYGNPNGATYTNGATIGSWMYTNMGVFSASYLSVKNLTLGYNFPQRWMDKIGIGGIRAYVSLDNMWMISAQSGVDPRMSLVGGVEVRQYTYPYMRTMSLGVNVTF